MDPSKVEAILSWPSPKLVGDVRSFHGLATFYRNFIVALIIKTIKGEIKCKFKWTEIVERIFQILKRKVAELPTLVLPSFDKVFTVECDSSKNAIGAVLS